MRAKVNERNNMSITELMNECHVSSVIAMATDYATSFTVYRNETSTHIDASFGWVGESDRKSFSILMAHSGAVVIYDMTNGCEPLVCEEYGSYEDAFERLINIFAGTDLDTSIGKYL